MDHGSAVLISDRLKTPEIYRANSPELHQRKQQLEREGHTLKIIRIQRKHPAADELAKARNAKPTTPPTAS